MCYLLYHQLFLHTVPVVKDVTLVFMFENCVISISWKEKVLVQLHWRSSCRRNPQPTARLHWPTPSWRASYRCNTHAHTQTNKQTPMSLQKQTKFGVSSVSVYLPQNTEYLFRFLPIPNISFIFSIHSLFVDVNHRRRTTPSSIISHCWPKSKENTSSLWRRWTNPSLNSSRSNSTEWNWWILLHIFSPLY